MAKATDTKRQSPDRAKQKVTVIKSIEIAGPRLQKRGYAARKDAAQRAQHRESQADAA